MFKKKKEELKEPADLGIVLVSKEEAIWTKMLDARKARLSSLEEEIIIEKALVGFCEDKLASAKKKA